MVDRERENVTWIQSGELSPGLLARAAEAAGRIADANIAVPALLQLLDHPDPVVQEGAIYGLERHLTEGVRRRLEKMVSDENTSSGVRAAAEDALCVE